MADDGTLAGDVAIVTGAGRNIGRAIATTFADEGARIVVADLDPDRAEATADIIEEDGGEAVPVEVDVTDEEQVAAMVAAAEDAFGPVDVLVNNAAISERTGLFDLSVETFDRVLAVNLRGPVLCTREAAKSMRDSGGGRIVNISSTSAQVARPNGIAYAASKKGLLSVTQSTANALADHDIRVNAILPTRTGSRVGAEEERTADPDADLLVGRWGRPQDQANAALFLVSTDSDFVTGAELRVDGGAMASTYNR